MTVLLMSGPDMFVSVRSDDVVVVSVCTTTTRRRRSPSGITAVSLVLEGAFADGGGT